jgi:glycosyltransferase involved in cell wall biosynthesis
MPAYNAAPYIGEAIESVISQSWQNWELIIVDDGSTDDTAAIIDREEDARIKVVHQPNMGVSAARNTALEMANGDFIAFLDADDYFPPRSLEVRLEVFSRDERVDVVGGRVSISDVKMERELHASAPNYQGPFLDRILEFDPNVFSGITYAIRAEKLKDLRFRVDLGNAEDLLFLIEASAAHGLHYSCTEELVYVYRNVSGSASKNAKNWAASMPLVVKAVNRLAISEELKRGFRRRVSMMLLKYAVRNLRPASLRAAFAMMISRE